MRLTSHRTGDLLWVPPLLPPTAPSTMGFGCETLATATGTTTGRAPHIHGSGNALRHPPSLPSPPDVSEITEHFLWSTVASPLWEILKLKVTCPGHSLAPLWEILKLKVTRPGQSLEQHSLNCFLNLLYIFSGGGSLDSYHAK